MTSNDEITLISSPNRTETVSITPYTSKSIEKLLKNKNEYKVVNNPGKRVKAACCTIFGFPARITSEKEFEIIPGFASCKDCFETFRHVDGSTTSLNEHQCPRIAAKGQQSIEECLNFVPQRSAVIDKLIKKKKENVKRLCAQWAATSMRPFQIVNDPGFRNIIQECLNIGA